MVSVPHLGRSLNHSETVVCLVGVQFLMRPVVKGRGGAWGIEGVRPGGGWINSSDVGTQERPGQEFRLIGMVL